MLHPPSQRRERILAFGPAGSGKTKGWYTIAQWILRTRANSNIFVMDTDNTWEAFNRGDMPFVHPYDIDSWTDVKKATDKIAEQAVLGRHDWCIADMADEFWDLAQEGYAERRYGKDLDEFFLEGAISGKGVAGNHGENWGYIKKMYRDPVKLMQHFSGHVYACSPAKEITDIEKDEEVRARFGRLGVRPLGNKKLPHNFHTVLYMQERYGGKGGWTMTTSKDRERERVTGKDVSDFVVDYLFAIAGWKP